jgi:hypothetical protein
MADHKDLDGVGEPRSREHREEMIEGHALDDVWDMFGIVGDLKVRTLPIQSFCHVLTTLPAFY